MVYNIPEMASTGDRKIKSNQFVINKSADSISIRRFFIIYLTLMVVFLSLAWFEPVYKIININDFYTKYVVFIISKILAMLSVPCSFKGSFIMLPALSLDVKFGCNGLEAIIMYSIAIAAYPGGWKKKLVWISAGFFILQAANILRIILLVYSGIYLKGLFDFIHIYMAQGIMIALALGIFFVYLNNAKKPETAHN